jgi:hypothetical protein
MLYKTASSTFLVWSLGILVCGLAYDGSAMGDIMRRQQACVPPPQNGGQGCVNPAANGLRKCHNAWVRCGCSTGDCTTTLEECIFGTGTCVDTYIACVASHTVGV